MNKKGFTLLELLAVIVILGVIIVIAAVSITNIMDDSRRKATEATAYAIIRTNSIYSLENSYYESMNVLDPRLNYDGDKPDYGIVQTNEDGDTRISIQMGDWCATKGYEDIEITITKTSDCDMS